ncbi:hypothetical protein HanIR_Chr10g0452701 [Helianthus annuus]|nr:hypothetical protein HanIR_Chr10g0452701 [Helianthus annuus]
MWRFDGALCTSHARIAARRTRVSQCSAAVWRARIGSQVTWRTPHGSEPRGRTPHGSEPQGRTAHERAWTWASVAHAAWQ